MRSALNELRFPISAVIRYPSFAGVHITKFTQLELAGNKISYVHTSTDEMNMDMFEFEVTDGFNPVVRTFRLVKIECESVQKLS